MSKNRRPVSGEWRPFEGAWGLRPARGSLLQVGARFELSVFTISGMDVLFAPTPEILLDDMDRGVKEGRLLYWLQGHPPLEV